MPESWLFPSDLKAAATVQRAMADRVVCRDDFGPVRVVAGVDVSSNPYDPSRMVYASIVLLSFPALQVIGQAHARGRAQMPYVPGYLAFREVPVLLEAWRQLETAPDLIFVDGHGISHPRGLGIASHLGVILDQPAIGVAKKILVGKPQAPLGEQPGDAVPLVWKERQIGYALRSKVRCNPLYIAPGHRVSMDSALHWVRQCLRGYRLPEPTRQAHLASNENRTSPALS